MDTKMLLRTDVHICPGCNEELTVGRYCRLCTGLANYFSSRDPIGDRSGGGLYANLPRVDMGVEVPLSAKIRNTSAFIGVCLVMSTVIGLTAIGALDVLGWISQR